METLCCYGTWLHGEAVSMGMIAIGELAVQLNNWSQEDASRQKVLLTKAGLPTRWPSIKEEDILRSLQGDKKVKEGKICFILPKKIGEVEIRNDIKNTSISECITRLIQMEA